MIRNRIGSVNRLARLGMVGLCLIAGSAQAQDRAAVVISNIGYQGPAALDDLRRDTEKMSTTLFGMGFDVQRFENAAAVDVTAALAALRDFDGTVVVYYAGHGFAVEGVSYALPVAATGDTAEVLAPQSIPMTELIGEGWVTILDTCHGAASHGVPGMGALDPSFNTVVQDTAEALMFISAAPGLACPAESAEQLTTVMLERLTVPGLPSDALLPEGEPVSADAEPVARLFTLSTRADPFVFRRANSGATLTRRDYEMLESISPSARAQLLAMWEQAGIAVDFADDGSAPAPATVGTVTNETVVLTSPVRPVATASAVAPVSVAAAGVATVSDGVQVLTVAPQQAAASTSRPVPGAGGLPLPSIIVGYPEEVVEATFDVVDDGEGLVAGAEVAAVGGSEITYDNVALRRDFAENNRELYLSLVESGAFDPPQAQMAVALQTELKRMNCYTAGIDGDWGRGSRASVGRYYEQIDGTAPSQDPTLEIWRQMMLKDDVRCPDIVVAQPAPRATTNSSSRTQSSSTPRRTQQAAPAPRAAPAPAPAAPAPRRTMNNAGGTGVFR